MAGVVAAYLRSSVNLTMPPASDGGTFASCDVGDIATGGGFGSTDGEDSLDIYEARPAGTDDDPLVPSSYLVRARNNTETEHDLQVWVACLDITQ